MCTRNVTSLRHPFSCNTIVTNLEVQDTDFMDTPTSLRFGLGEAVKVVHGFCLIKSALLDSQHVVRFKASVPDKSSVVRVRTVIHFCLRLRPRHALLVLLHTNSQVLRLCRLAGLMVLFTTSLESPSLWRRLGVFGLERRRRRLLR